MSTDSVLLTRLYSNLQILGPTGCWEWTRRRLKDGYGSMSINSRETLVHRVSYKLHIGIISDDLCCLHTCDNPPCFNPDHLFLGTHAINMLDMSLKGRANRSSINVGEDNPGCKLTEKEVIEILELLHSNIFTSQSSIAKIYGVSQVIISKIYRKILWKNIVMSKDY